MNEEEYWSTSRFGVVDELLPKKIKLSDAELEAIERDCRRAALGNVVLTTNNVLRLLEELRQLRQTQPDLDQIARALQGEFRHSFKSATRSDIIRVLKRALAPKGEGQQWIR